jgi:hypothetical protein
MIAPDDGWRNRLKHVEHFIEINKLRKAASCWLHFENILKMHGLMNIKNILFMSVLKNDFNSTPVQRHEQSPSKMDFYLFFAIHLKTFLISGFYRYE